MNSLFHPGKYEQIFTSSGLLTLLYSRNISFPQKSPWSWIGYPHSLLYHTGRPACTTDGSLSLSFNSVSRYHTVCIFVDFFFFSLTILLTLCYATVYSCGQNCYLLLHNILLCDYHKFLLILILIWRLFKKNFFFFAFMNHFTMKM